MSTQQWREICGNVYDDGVAACANTAARMIRAKGRGIPVSVVVMSGGTVRLASPDSTTSKGAERIGTYAYDGAQFTLRAIEAIITGDLVATAGEAQ